MEAALVDQMAVTLTVPDAAVQLRANGSVVTFKGFLEVYEEGPSLAKATEEEEEGMGRILPPLDKGQAVSVAQVTPSQHFTQPPPRFSEASLVKALEEKGIGRPSTYASIIQVLQDRKYVRMDNRRFVPEDRGRIVIAFLESFFGHYVEYDFTARLEEQLDDISGGRLKWKDVLAEFWRDFIAAVEGTKDLSRTAVIDALDAMLEPHLFPERADGSNPRACPACSEGRIGLKFGRFGAFIGCSRYPDCRYTRPLGAPEPAPGTIGLDKPKELGADPATGKMVTLRAGPYGPYVQLGEPETIVPAPAKPNGAAKANGNGEAKAAAKPKRAKKPEVIKPKRASLPKGTDPAAVDLARALKILALPREVGAHPETGEIIYAGLGRFGPYLKMGTRYVSLKGDDDVLEIGLNRAVVVLAEAKPKGQGRGAPGKLIGNHPEDGKAITLKAGRYGHYVQHGQVRATIPRDTEPDSVTVDAAVALLTARAAKATPAKATGSRRGGRRGAAGSAAEA
jgi:DNA topoisomerase-1